MSKFKLACHLIQFAGEQNENPEKVFREVAAAGWNGVEGISISSSDNLIEMATLASRFGLHLVNVGGHGISLDAVKYNITLGNGAVEVPGLRRSDWGGDNPTEIDFKRAAQTLGEILDFCAQHNIKGFHHAHLGLQVVIEDYVSTEWVKLFSIIVVKLGLLALAITAIFSVLKIALGS